MTDLLQYCLTFQIDVIQQRAITDCFMLVIF
jgi:hypothetical protein